MHTPDDAAPLAVIYLRIIFVALPFMYFYNFVMMTLRGAGTRARRSISCCCRWCSMWC